MVCTIDMSSTEGIKTHFNNDYSQDNQLLFYLDTNWIEYSVEFEDYYLNTLYDSLESNHQSVELLDW